MADSFLKSPTIPNAGKDVEKEKLFFFFLQLMLGLSRKYRR